MPSSPDCIFCKIWRAEIPAETLFHDADILAIKDIHPKAPVHILIIPRRHLPSVAELEPGDASLIGEMVLRAARLAEELEIDQAGYRLVFNTRHHSGQEVDHIHLHLIGGKPLGTMA
jgi:histidine triad (HIT) family protein